MGGTGMAGLTLRREAPRPADPRLDAPEEPVAAMPTRLAAVLVSTPPLLIALAWLATLLLSALTGEHPLWSDHPRNLSEAAAFRDAGAVVRRVARGEELNRAAEVRAGVVLDEAAVLTPLEAAAASRERAMVQLLFDLGVSLNAAEWQRAWCISTASSVQELLDSRRPDGAMKDCGDPQ